MITTMFQRLLIRPLPTSGSGATTCWAIGFVLLILVVGAGCIETEETPQPASDEVIPDQEIYDYELIESNDGVKDWILVSQRMERFADREDVELYEVTMDFYKNGVYFSTLTSRRGRANVRSKNLFAWGEVVVVTEDGRRLETEELHYKDAAERIHNDVYNRFSWGEDVMTGYGLEATPDLEYLEIKEHVNAEIEDENHAEGETE
ncbi:MAG: LPS export ABC transporter periplasmic protein LptC [bacterium]